MAYSKTVWENLPSTNTPLNASNLNKIEDELEDLDTLRNYSFNETQVGVWVDGSPLYRKVFLITSQDTLHGISNPHHTSIVSAMVYDSSLYGSRDVSSDIIFQSNKFWLTGDALSLVSGGINLIVEYTKSTD